jgi:hypothetical protein
MIRPPLKNTRWQSLLTFSKTFENESNNLIPTTKIRDSGFYFGRSFKTIYGQWNMSQQKRKPWRF